MEKGIAKFRHWAGLFIVMIGMVGASHGMELEKSAYRKADLNRMMQEVLIGEDIQLDSYERGSSDFGLAEIEQPSDVREIMIKQGYVNVNSRVTLCHLGAVPILGCDPTGSGREIYLSKSEPQNYVAVAFEPTRRIDGCQFEVLSVIEWIPH